MTNVFIFSLTYFFGAMLITMRKLLDTILLPAATSVKWSRNPTYSPRGAGKESVFTSF